MSTYSPSVDAERVLEGNSVSAQLPYRERRLLGITELEEI